MVVWLVADEMMSCCCEVLNSVRHSRSQRWNRDSSDESMTSSDQCAGSGS